MNIKDAINALLNNTDLTRTEMQDVMQQIMTGQCSDAQIGGFLVALRAKGETVDEIAGAATVMRKLATPVEVTADHLVDIVGTGGDSAGTFNVSTASTFVAAAAGATVAKHGNRSVSSKSGSADLLEAAGVNLNLSADQVKQCIEQVGVGFMFAVNHHAAMKHAIGPRRELGARTVFNLLGPLTNPASVPNLLLGVFSRDWLRPVAEVMRELGTQHVLVVHSADGLDEISIAAETWVAELKGGEVTEYQISPEDFGLPRSSLDPLKVADAEESLAMVKTALTDAGHPAAQMVAMNAGAALYVAGVAEDLLIGVECALTAIKSGAALEKLNQLASLSSTL
ncbi:anthranilate phosphoribosyltransferase [Porticoccus sp. W117]|uniref:anthranilate phosphoribosyltransferase n=1 Tax=Porticoccus sp. W117 TaxID=3054777 RepID=UPI002594FA91|nr:anthranilate phosphoribosyltransferase [Porticoccus sp. W117]MDM3870569.1 anthranilate phosphoribosyltransferase [Porticoccus sp. W117]